MKAGRWTGAALAALLLATGAFAQQPTTFAELNEAAIAAYQAGEYDAASAHWATILRIADSRGTLDLSRIAYNLACSYALAGRNDDALAVLEEITEAITPGQLMSDRDLDGLRDDPRFADLAEAVATLEATRQRIYDQLPYSTDEGIDLTPAAKIAGLSKLWAEAKFGFAYFDQVPELDWDALYVATIPKVMATTSTEAYYRLLIEMAAKLEDGHTSVSYPGALRDRVHARPAITTDLVEDRVVVLDILNDAVRASGVDIGDVIVTIDEAPVREYANQHVAPYVASSTPQDRRIRVYDYELLAGDSEQPVVLGLEKPDGSTASVPLERGLERSKSRAPIRWEILEGNVGYIAINTFDDPEVNARLPEAMEELRTTRGLVIDIRWNGGGTSGWWVMEFLSERYRTTQWATRKYLPVYRAWGRPQTWHRVSPSVHRSSREWLYEQPVVLLIGPRTFSAAEDFAAVFQGEGRGTLLGEPTGGSTGQPLVFQLPAGGWARICAKRDRMADGREFVGSGIQPDLLIPLTIEDVRAGRDPVLEAALAGLR